jgi:hypothetical protein
MNGWKKMTGGNPAMGLSAWLVHPAGRVKIFTELTKAHLAFSIALAGMALLLPAGMAAFFRRCPVPKTATGFYAVNLSMLCFMALGILDHLLV